MDTVVLVEDDADTRELMTIAVQMAGYGIQTFPLFEPALAYIREVKPCVVITDYMVKGASMTASDFVRVVRELTKDIKIIVITGAVQLAEQNMTSVDAFLAKPFDLTDVLKLITSVCHPAAASQ